jgi:hypothetical protein
MGACKRWVVVAISLRFRYAWRSRRKFGIYISFVNLDIDLDDCIVYIVLYCITCKEPTKDIYVYIPLYSHNLDSALCALSAQTASKNPQLRNCLPLIRRIQCNEARTLQSGSGNPSGECMRVIIEASCRFFQGIGGIEYDTATIGIWHAKCIMRCMLF